MRALSCQLSVLAAAAFVFATTSCSTTAPTLPSDADPTTVHEHLTSDAGAAFLDAISTYDWPDEGARAGDYFSWIQRDTTSSDPETANLAGESARALANFLVDKASELTSIPHGFLDLQHSSIGAMNPKLVAAFAAALTPYQGAMAGNADGVRGFGSLSDATDFSAARAVFGVIATDPVAGAQFVQNAYDRAVKVATDAAEAVCVREDGSAVSNAVHEAGVLSGLAASVANQKTVDGIAQKSSGQALDDVIYAMTSVCVPTETLPLPGRINKFVENGALITPARAMERYQTVEEYFQSQRDYLANRGASVASFSDGYDAALGGRSAAS